MDAEEIRRIRHRLGMTQLSLAQLVGVTWTTVSRWERGGTTPTPYQQGLLSAFDAAATRRGREVKSIVRGVATEGAIRVLYKLLHAAYGEER